MLPKSIDTLRIDINSGKVRKSVAICQQDSVQRTLNFQLVDSGTALDMSNLLFAEILIHKADGYEADNGCVIDGDSVQYTLRSTDTSALGTNIAQLQLTFADGQVITTPTFEIEVYSKVLDQRVQTSTNEYTALTQQLIQVTELKNQTEEFKDAAEVSAQTASEKAEEVVASAEAAAQSALAAQSSANEAAQSVEQVEIAANNAAESATNAATSATSAATSASSAAASATAAREIADGIAEDCQDYVTEAQTYARNALESFHAAEDEATNAQSYAEAAATSATNAENAAQTAAENAQQETVDLLDRTFQNYVNRAETAATGAQDSASMASTKASQAEDYSNNAYSYAEDAAASAQEAREAAAAAGGLELGESSTNAYRGDRGKVAYDHSQTTGNPHATTYSDVGADQAGAAASAYQQATGYTDLKISQLIDGAPQTLDTLKEIADAMEESQDVVEALQQAIGNKVDEADFTGHANNNTIHVTANEKSTWNASASRVSNIHRIIHATCSTPAATQKKTITLIDSVTLEDGDIIAINFNETNSFNCSDTNGYVTFSIGNVSYTIVSLISTTGVITKPTGTNSNYYGAYRQTHIYKVDATNHMLIYLLHSSDNNTTYTPQSLGFGYGTCTTAAATAAKVATLSGYNLVTNGFVAIKFTYAVPAIATLNINSRGAKAIYYKGAAITANIINAGDTALFVYNGSQYHLIAIDNIINRVATLEAMIGYPISRS